MPLYFNIHYIKINVKLQQWLYEQNNNNLNCKKNKEADMVNFQVFIPACTHRNREKYAKSSFRRSNHMQNTNWASANKIISANN